jgi:hypothetical protein
MGLGYDNPAAFTTMFKRRIWNSAAHHLKQHN